MTSTSLLSRQNLLETSPELSRQQLSLDATLSSFSDQVTDPYSIAAVVAGGSLFRVLRGAGVSVLGNLVTESRAGAALLKTAVNGAALVGEAGAFVGTERGLRVGFGGADRSLLQWEGANGLRNAWLGSVVNFGALRGSGLFTTSLNPVLQHMGAATAMVSANQATASLGITERPQGNLVEQFVQASVLDIQMRGSMSLLHAVAPGLSVWERSVDLAYEARTSRLPNLPHFANHNGLEPILTAAGVDLSRAERPADFLSNVMMMSGEGGGNAGREIAVQDPTSLTKRESKAEVRLRRQVEQIEKLAADPRVAEHTEAILAELRNPNRSIAENTLAAKALFEAKLSKLPILSSKGAEAFLNLRHLVPNGLTATASLMAVWGAAMSINGEYSTAAKMLIAAAIIDKADGVVARAMRATHSIGAKLDSYADFANYGIASAILTYSVLKGHGESGMAWTISTIIALNATLRLATFDHLDEAPKQVPPHDVLGNPILGNGHDFTGMPSTVMGLILPAAYFMFGRNNPEAFYGVSAAAGLAMYAPLRYPKLTDGVLGWLARKPQLLTGVVGALGVAGYHDPRYVGWTVLAGLGTYVASPFLQAGKRFVRNVFGKNNPPSANGTLQLAVDPNHPNDHLPKVIVDNGAAHRAEVADARRDRPDTEEEGLLGGGVEVEAPSSGEGSGSGRPPQ